LCEELKKLKQGNPEDEYPVCPIPAEHYLTFSKSKELGFMKSFAKVHINSMCMSQTMKLHDYSS
jgi:hypothetical protein